MISELLIISVGAILINNFVLVQFLGICPFLGVSKKVEPQREWVWLLSLLCCAHLH